MSEAYGGQADNLNQETISEHGAELSVDKERDRQLAWWDAFYHGRDPVTGEPADAATRASMLRAARNADLSDGPIYRPEIADFRESQRPITWLNWLLSRLCRN